MSDLLYDKWREFYLQQLAAGEISTETRQYDLEQMWLSTQLNSKVINVTEGQSVQAAIDAAVEAGAGRENPWIINLKPGEYTESVHVPSGLNIVGTGTDCVFHCNLILHGSSSAYGIVIDDGYYVEQNGVKYYG